MLPYSEIDTLTLTVTEAVDLATEGRAADGYTALLAGLERAQELAEEPEAFPWSPELVSRWRIAVDRYCETYGVPLA